MTDPRNSMPNPDSPPPDQAMIPKPEPGPKPHDDTVETEAQPGKEKLMNDDQKHNPTNSTEMTDQQAVTNDLSTGPGRGARQEPGAHPDQELINEKVKGDARGDLSDETAANSGQEG